MNEPIISTKTKEAKIIPFAHEDKDRKYKVQKMLFGDKLKDVIKPWLDGWIRLISMWISNIISTAGKHINS